MASTLYLSLDSVVFMEVLFPSMQNLFFGSLRGKASLAVIHMSIVSNNMWPATFAHISHIECVSLRTCEVTAECVHDYIVS